jgi:hypothetical protein
MSSSHPMARRVLTILAITVCVVVCVISAVCAVGSIVIGQAAKDALNSAVLGIEQAIEAGQQGITTINSTLSTVTSATQQVQTAVSQIGPTVSDKGLIASLLPDAQLQALASAATSLKETLASIQKALDAAASMYQAASKIPFIQLPTIPDDKLQGAADLITQISTLLTQLTQTLTDVKAGLTSAVGQVTSTLSTINTQLVTLSSRLDQADSSLTAVLAKLETVRKQAPTWINVAMILFFLLFSWSAGTQIYLIRRAWRYYKSISATPAQAPAAG